MNTEKLTPDFWIDDDGYIAHGAADDYDTYAETFGTQIQIKERARFIVNACNSYQDMYEALKKVSQSAFFDELPASTQNAVLDSITKANPQSV